MSETLRDNTIFQLVMILSGISLIVMTIYKNRPNKKAIIITLSILVTSMSYLLFKTLEAGVFNVK